MAKAKSRNRVTVTVGYRLNEHGVKVPVRKEFVGKTMKEARQKRDEYLLKMNSGLSGEKQYFAIIAEQWRENVFKKDGSLSPNTITLYDGAWERYIKKAVFYPMKLMEISPIIVQEEINKMVSKDGVPLSSIRAIINVLSRLYKYLEATGQARNFMKSIVVPSHTYKERKEDGNNMIEEKNISTWSEEELSTILGSFYKAQKGFRLRFLIVLASCTGCRISEMLALEYSDFNVKAKTVSINKQVINYQGELAYGKLKSRSSYRTIPLTDYVLEELEVHRRWHETEMQEKHYYTNNVFTTNSGSLVDRHNASSSCNRYYERIGVPSKGFHTYRHTFCTRLCEGGVSIETVAALAGHRSIDVTAQHYVGISDERKANAVRMLEQTFEEKG